MVLSSCQQITTLLSKHVLNYKRNKTFIKEIIAMLIVGAICMLLNSGGVVDCKIYLCTCP